MILALVVALILPIALGYVGVSQALGAHPWWGLSTTVIGAPVGCVLGLALAVMRLGRVPRLIAGVAVSGGTAAVAIWGKTQFAASYGEDALAGSLWYFGWIGIAAGLALVLFALLSPGRLPASGQTP